MTPTRAALAALLLLPLTLALAAATPQDSRGAAPAAAAQDLARPPIIVVMDADRVLEGSKYAQALQGRLKGLEDSIRRQLDPMQEGLQKRRADFESGQAAMTPEQRASEARALADLEKQLQMAGQQAQQAYTQQRDALAFQFRQAMEPVLEALGKEKGWDMIFSRPGDDLVWNSKRLDITDLVIERLNSLPMPEETPAAPAGSPAPAPTAGTPTPAPKR